MGKPRRPRFSLGSGQISRSWAVAVAIVLGLILPPADAAQDDPVGRTISRLSLVDVAGHREELSTIPPEQPVVLVFLGTECPLAKQYAARVQQIADAVPAARFFAIFSNAQDDAQEITAYATQHGLQLPLIRDEGNRIADRCSATRTPEAFVLDAERTICYHGRIDDQFGIGYAKAAPTQTELRAALADLLAGRAVAVPTVPAVGCLIGRVKRPSETTQRLIGEAAAVLNQNCVSCHRSGEIAPFALDDPQEIAGWAEMINEVVQNGRMPPWQAVGEAGHFANDRRLSEQAKQAIAAWVAAGAPTGTANDWPAPPPFVAGWQLPEPPDLVLPVSSQPVEVPARGEMEYQYYESSHVFSEDTWVRGVQILPGNHRVVHHILAFVTDQPAAESIGQLEGIDGYLAGYVPGLIATPYPAGMAKRIPRGSRLLFQVHYTPLGTPQTDASQIGLLLADPATIEREVITTSALRRQLEIPPRAAAHRVTAFSHRQLDQALLLGMMPHLHLRGKSFAYELQRSDGTCLPLLQVPAYDFNWQTSYRLAEPLPLRAGDRICCVAEYDNSPANPNNPNPDTTVRWGDQTREEMMIGYFDLAVPRTDDPGRSPLELERHVAMLRWWDPHDHNRDGRLDESEVSPRLRERFIQFDRNHDHQVSFAELAAGWPD